MADSQVSRVETDEAITRFIGVRGYWWYGEQFINKADLVAMFRLMDSEGVAAWLEKLALDPPDQMEHLFPQPDPLAEWSVD